MSTIVAFSGGKDSTAMAYRMAELGERFELFFTPTMNELPPVFDHIQRVVQNLDVELIVPEGPSLDDLIRKWGALPNNRQRWCTREIKIEPAARWLKAHPGTTLCVGLRDDEPLRKGLYGAFAEYRYPLREWNWDIDDVLGYIGALDIDVPPRTDCAVCPFQRLREWRDLLEQWPAYYQQGIEYEELTGYTFRSPSRDTWPADLASLATEFRSGRKIIERKSIKRCRICRL